MRRAVGRIFQHITRRGPHGVAPFATLAPDLLSVRVPLALGPCPDGVIHSVEADATASADTLSLLGQQFTTLALPVARLSPVRQLFALRDVCVAGDAGVVWCPHLGLAVAETSRQWHGGPDTHPLLSAPRFPAAMPLSGTTLNLGSLGAGGYYHFLHESLPRLVIAREWLDRVDHFLCPGLPGGFHSGWLELAGVPSAKIKWLHGHSHWRCEQLLFTNLPTDDCAPSAWLFAAIRRLARWSPATHATRRVWLTRRDASSRHLAWEDRLLTHLPGFEPIYLSRLPAAEQVAVFASAAVVAGPHGAAFANLPFCHPAARVVELLPDLQPRPLYARLAAAAGLRHAWVAVNFSQEPDDLPALGTVIRAFTS